MSDHLIGTAREARRMRGLFALGLGIALGVTIAIILAAREDAPGAVPIPAGGA